jgi:hypothetical protein
VEKNRGGTEGKEGGKKRKERIQKKEMIKKVRKFLGIYNCENVRSPASAMNWLLKFQNMSYVCKLFSNSPKASLFMKHFSKTKNLQLKKPVQLKNPCTLRPL